MWMQIVYSGWICLCGGFDGKEATNADRVQIEIVPIDAVAGEKLTHASNEEPLRLAMKYGVQLATPYHPRCYLGCDGEQLFYWFFNNSKIKTLNGNVEEEFLVQRVKSTGKTNFSSAVPKRMFTVEAVSLENGQSAIPDRHWGEIALQVPAKFQTEFEIGVGNAPEILSDTKWPFSTRGKILSCSDDQTNFDQVRFRHSHRWAMNLEVEPSKLGTFCLSVPETKIEIVGNIADLMTRSGFGKIVPGRGVGTLVLGVSSIMDVKRILGPPFRTEEWSKLKKSVLFFQNGMMTICDADTYLLTTIGLSPPFRGITTGGVRPGSEMKEAEFEFGPLQDGDTIRSHGMTIYCSSTGLVESMLLTGINDSTPTTPLLTKPIYEPQGLKNILR